MATVTLTDWLRSDWLETKTELAKPPIKPAFAYRLASIGLVGNDILPNPRSDLLRAYRLASIGLVGNFLMAEPVRIPSTIRLPIGFDRIGWKPMTFAAIWVLTHRAYRLASIGLVGNMSLSGGQGSKLSKLTDRLRLN